MLWVTSTNMEENEDQTLKILKVCRNIIDGLVKEYHGRIFNTAGDSVLAEFQSGVEAVIFASEFQNTVLSIFRLRMELKGMPGKR